MYKEARKRAGISIEEAAWRLHIGSRTLVNYENGHTIAPPEIVLKMAEVYGQPTITAMYCAEHCPIGQIYAYPVQDVDLATAVLGLLKEHNNLRVVRDRLIDIAADGMITNEELAEFEQILDELLELERRIEALKLWASRIIPVSKLIRRKKEKAALAAY